MPKSRMDIPLHLLDYSIDITVEAKRDGNLRFASQDELRNSLHRVSKLYNKMKRKEATVAAIKFPLTIEKNDDGQLEIIDANSLIVCTCTSFEIVQAVYLALYCAQAAERVQAAAAALSGLGSFETKALS